MEQSKGHRTKIEIIADILKFLRLGENGRIEITYTVKLSHSQTTKYLNWLLEMKLLEDIESEIGIPSYRITKKGLALLSKIESTAEMLPQNGVLNILHKSRVIETNIPEKRISESSELKKT